MLNALTNALATNGFIYIGQSEKGWPIYNGSIVAADIICPVKIIVDPNGIELPIIQLDPVPKRLLPIAPHIGNKGNICYAAAGSIVLDIFDLPGQVLSCIDRAELILTRIIKGEMINDLEEEFFAYWVGEQIFIDIENEKMDLFTYYL